MSDKRPLRQLLSHFIDTTGSSPENGRAPSVLIVDDEPQVCEFARRVLVAAGYEASVANGGAAALASVERRGTPDLLLTDLKMPEMQGDELAARLRRQHPDLKVLYFTGFSNDLFDNRSTLWEGEAFLDKPCSPVGLIQGVSLLLHGQMSGPSTTGGSGESV